ncbi:hypothetical protein SSCG_00413 [Streptomyces clavuligerus]|nr:hypothetical protein SSCG_00413 [Streptomyces clavuligerus]
MVRPGQPGTPPRGFPGRRPGNGPLRAGAPPETEPGPPTIRGTALPPPAGEPIDGGGAAALERHARPRAGVHSRPRLKRWKR